MRILGLSGSLRRDSYNTHLLTNARELLLDGVELELFEGLKDIPPYDEDDDREPAPVAVETFRDAITAAEAVLIATPEYNSSVPGQLKNALDWASRPLATNPFRNTPVAVVGASTGMFGAVWAQAELKKVLGAMGARVVAGELPVGRAREQFDADGRLVDPELRARLAELVYALVDEAVPVPAATATRDAASVRAA